MAHGQQIIDLVIADDDDFARLAFGRAFARSGLPHQLHVATDGEAALDLLQTLRQRGSSPLVLLTDLHMPRMDGLALIRSLRGDPDLRSTVVYVVSSSDDRHDVSTAYDLGVAGYVLKQDQSPEFMPFFRLLEAVSETLHFPSPDQTDLRYRAS